MKLTAKNIGISLLVGANVLLILAIVWATRVPRSANAQGQTCLFTEANCSWDAVQGAVSYSVKITDVDTGTVIKTDTVQAPTTTYVFPVTQNQTYQCDVSAVNSCGTGPAGSASALCAANGLVESPTPSPSVAPPPVATVTPTPAPIICGNSGCKTSADCATGLTCVTTNSGLGYCAQPNLQQACALNPGASACCIAPTPTPVPPRPTLPPTGSSGGTLAAGLGALSSIAIGIFLIWKSAM